MGVSKKSEKLLQEVGFYESLTGSLDILCDDARQTAKEQKEHWEKISNELMDIGKKVSLIENSIVERRHKQTRALVAASKELETLRHEPPTLRKESFTLWWESFDKAVQKIADIAAHIE